jgi:hypothetical protein
MRINSREAVPALTMAESVKYVRLPGERRRHRSSDELGAG